MKELCCKPGIEAAEGNKQNKGKIHSAYGWWGVDKGEMMVVLVDLFYQQLEFYSYCGFILPEVSTLTKNAAVI